MYADHKHQGVTCSFAATCDVMNVRSSSVNTQFGETCLVFPRLICRDLHAQRALYNSYHYRLLEKCRALLSVVERGWPKALDFSFDLELNILQMYYLMNISFIECFVHHLIDSNCTCVRSTTLDNFALDQISLDKKQSSQLH